MAKHIDADDLMRRMYNRAFETDGDTMWQSGCWVRYRAIEAVVKETPAVDIPRWIPVTERLPEEDYETGNGVQFSADVLATIVNHANDGELYCWLLKTVDGKWYDYVPNWEGEHEVPHWCEVIAWMPLPEPYKGEANG